MGNYVNVFREAWSELVTWHSQGRFVPENEEEVQCFLYYAMVSALGDARAVKPKPTTDKPERLRFQDGNWDVGNMHFPDFSLGGSQEVVVEIKFARHPKQAPNLYNACKEDIVKMLAHHPNSKRFFVLYDMHPDFVFLDEQQLHNLQALDSDCEILRHPKALNQSPAKCWARAAVQTMKDRGDDFHERGRRNAAKAVKGKK